MYIDAEDCPLATDINVDGYTAPKTPPTYSCKRNLTRSQFVCKQVGVWHGMVWYGIVWYGVSGCSQRLRDEGLVNVTAPPFSADPTGQKDATHALQVRDLGVHRACIPALVQVCESASVPWVAVSSPIGTT